MADAPIITEKDAYEQLGNGLLALVGLATSNSTSTPLQGAIALAGPTVALIFTRGMHRYAKRRLPKFATSFLSPFDRVPEEAAKKVNAAAENETFTESLDDIMMRSFRLMMDSVDDSVVPVLGYMAGLYTLEQRKPNYFFRSFGRLLCELEPGELDDLRKIVSVAQRQSNHREDPNLELDETGKVWAAIPNRTALAVEAVSHAGRIFALLKREQLARNVTPGVPRFGTVNPAADATMSMSHVVLDEMARMLMLPAAAT